MPQTDRQTDRQTTTTTTKTIIVHHSHTDRRIVLTHYPDTDRHIVLTHSPDTDRHEPNTDRCRRSNINIRKFSVTPRPDRHHPSQTTTHPTPNVTRRQIHHPYKSPRQNIPDMISSHTPAMYFRPSETPGTSRYHANR